MARRIAGDEWDDRWGLVFTEPDGRYVHPDTFSTRHRKEVREVDVPTIRRLRSPERAANVILRAAAPEVGLPPEVPDLVVAIDLIESPLPRVRGVGEDALRRLL